MRPYRPGAGTSCWWDDAGFLRGVHVQRDLILGSVVLGGLFILKEQ